MKTNVIILDTNILIDYTHGYCSWLGKILTDKSTDLKLILPTIVIAEFFTSTALENSKEQKVADRTFAQFIKQDLTEEIAKILGSLLRRKSYTKNAGLADLIIASTAIFLQGELATRNKKDFARIPDLRFFDPRRL